MKSANTSIISGIVLMTVGLVLLLDRLGVTESTAYLPPLFFATVGVVFVSLFIRSPDNWWAAIPGSVFLGLAALTTAAQLTDGGAVAAILFLFMGAGFAAVYVRQTANWWALIPCGVMVTLAVITALPRELQGMPLAAVLFLGLAATFGVLSLVPVRSSGKTGTSAGASRMKWPVIPAAALAVLGVVFALQSTSLFVAGDFAGLAVMILAGVALLVYGYRAGHDRQHKAHGSWYGRAMNPGAPISAVPDRGHQRGDTPQSSSG